MPWDRTLRYTSSTQMSESADRLADVLETIEDTVEAVEDVAVVLRAEARRTGWFRVEYLFFGLVAAFFAGYVLAYIIIGVTFDTLEGWGYVGIFCIAMAGSATIVLPTPSNVAIFGSSALLDPVFGIPAPLIVGLVAGLGDEIGRAHV